MSIITFNNNADATDSATTNTTTNSASTSTSASSSSQNDQQAPQYYCYATKSCTDLQRPPSQQHHPEPYDVLCDRNISSFNNVGNKRFRVVCEIYIPRYTKAKTKREGSKIFRTIVDTVHNGGGKFLSKVSTTTPSNEQQQSSCCWEEVSDSQAREKVGHTLRAALVAIQSATSKNSPRTIYDVINDLTEHFMRRKNSSVSSILESSVSMTTPEKKNESSSSPNAASPKKAFHTQYSTMNLIDCRLKSIFQERVVHQPYAETRLMMQTAADSSDDESLKHSRHQQVDVQTRYTVSQPGPFDVLCDKNRAAFHHAGNKRFRAICKQFVPQYKDASTKGKKGKLFKAIVAMVHESGGKFLTKRASSDNWEEVSSVRRAKEKVGHALRAALQRSNDETDQDNDEERMPASSLPPLLLECQPDIEAILSISRAKHTATFCINDTEEVKHAVTSTNYNDKEVDDSIFFPDIRQHEQKEQQTAPTNDGDFYHLLRDLDENFHWDTPSAPLLLVSTVSGNIIN
jgi:hypothetical protein